MARVENALLGQGQAYMFGTTNPALDIALGGQMGWSVNMVEWVNAQPYVRIDMVPIVMEVPTGFQDLPDSQLWIDAYVALWGTRMSRITGIQSTLTVDVVESAVGRAGEMFEVPSNATMARSQLSTECDEIYGRPIQKYLEAYNNLLIRDPNTGIANINTLSSTTRTDMLADVYSGTILFFEPNPCFAEPQDAVLCCNVFPKGAGDRTMSRELGQGGDKVTLNIEWGCIAQRGYGVLKLAREMMQLINIAGANPTMAVPLVSEASADAQSARRSFQQGVADLAANQVTV